MNTNPYLRKIFSNEALYHRLISDPGMGITLVEEIFTKANAAGDTAELEYVLQLVEEVINETNQSDLRVTQLLHKLESIAQHSLDEELIENSPVHQMHAPDESGEIFRGDATIEDLLSKFGNVNRRDRKRRQDDEDEPESGDRYQRRQREAIRRTLQQLSDDE